LVNVGSKSSRSRSNRGTALFKTPGNLKEDGVFHKISISSATKLILETEQSDNSSRINFKVEHCRKSYEKK
tara:strand:+ start:300 stop:512 length:213 start_codon:yes stop_codon:yes gene_type:complete